MNEQEIKLPEIDHELLAGYGELWKAIVAWEEKGKDRKAEANRVDEIVKSMMNAHAREAVRMNQKQTQATPERRPFDLEAAKRGEPLVTREGKEAKFIAHVPDARKTEKLLYLVGDIVYATGEDGYSFTDDSADLFMAPKPKRTAWANTYYHDTKESALMRGDGAALVAVPVQIDA